MQLLLSAEVLSAPRNCSLFSADSCPTDTRVCTQNNCLYQVGYGAIVCDQLIRSRWRVARSFFPGHETPATIGQRVLDRTAVPQGGDRLTFPDVSWDELLNDWIFPVPAEVYGTGPVLASVTNGRTQLFWVGTLMRDPLISAYLSSHDSFPCYKSPDAWDGRCQGYYAKRDDGTKLLCGVVNGWHKILQCKGDQACIDAYIASG